MSRAEHELSNEPAAAQPRPAPLELTPNQRKVIAERYQRDDPTPEGVVLDGSRVAAFSFPASRGTDRQTRGGGLLSRPSTRPEAPVRHLLRDRHGAIILEVHHIVILNPLAASNLLRRGRRLGFGLAGPG